MNMKCKNCNKELNPYTPKPFCNIDCENNYNKKQKENKEYGDNFIKDFFGGIFNNKK